MTLEAWYRQYGYAVHARCLRLLGSRADADDALHEVFVRVQRALPKAEPEMPLRWLYRIADNHCLDVLKRRRFQVVGKNGEAALRMHLQNPSPESPERDRFIAQVLVSLSDDVRQVAILYFVDELTQDEVADAVGCSRKTVKKRLAEFREEAERLNAFVENR